MNLFYVNGGGLGHLSRINAFIFTKKIKLEECLILTSSEFATLLFPISNIKTIPNKYSEDKKKLVLFIKNTIDENSFENIYIDTFPLGILGELQFVDFKGISLNYIARHLKWNLYSSLYQYANLKYKFTYIVENVDNEHFEFIDSNSNQQLRLTLDYQKSKPTKEVLEIFNSPKEIWLIVHSTPIDEVLALLEHAKDIANVENKNPQFVIISQSKLGISEDIIQLDYFPAYNLFPYANKIISGCGFNIMQQTKNFRKKHIAIPFPRKFDDQFNRKKSLPH